jgi:hypothetical protein
MEEGLKVGREQFMPGHTKELRFFSEINRKTLEHF